MSKKQAINLKNCTLLQLYARAPAPSRDYYGLTIAESCICINIWKITHGPHVFPKQKFCDIQDFTDDRFLQEEIKNIFGDNVFEYILNVRYRIRTLENIPQKVFLRIVEYLKINDVLKLARSNKIFYELCNREEVWQIIFRKSLHRNPSAEEKRMAFDCGWREALQRRLMYIKKAFAASKKSKSSPTNLPHAVKSAKSITNKKPLVPKKNLVKAK